ncbi:MAG: hypothetical protein FJ217_12520 [Ignavibacteria bacterium]|nr:hypothetical protein [Ignavibacteria bacterium]
MTRHRRRYLRVLGFLGLSCFAAFSIVFAGGSSYSRFGVGDLLRYGGSRLDAMGGAGIALLGDGFINRLNPAGLSRISRTRISGGLEYSSYFSKDSKEEGRYSRAAFKGVAFAIPIDKDYGITLLLESSPYSYVHYATQVRDTVVTQDFFGTGGLSALSFGGSVTPLDKFSVGFKLNYLFGRIRQFGRFGFADPTFLDSEISRSDFHSGFSFTAGAIYEGLSDLLNAPSLSPLTLGFVLTTPTTLSVERESVFSTAESFDTTATSSGKVDVPLGFGFGASYLLASRYYLTADAYHQSWGSAKFFGVHPAELRNSTRVGVGFESLPQRETASFLQRVAYRAGFYYNSTYYTFNNSPVDEWFVTGGFGVPIGPEARINIGLHLGFRGTTSNNLQRDTIFRLSLSLSANEAWFIRIEED